MFLSLQAGRAVAALMVVLFHLGGTAALPRYSGIDALAIPFAFGHAGVDFFFVLSGFIIVFIHRGDFGQPQRLGRYLLKRGVRVLPMYWLVFASIFALAQLVPAAAATLPTDGWLILRALLLVPLDVAEVGGTGAPVLVVAWSMQYEMFFYAIVAAFIISRPLGLALGVAIAVAAGAGGDFPASFITGGPWLLEFLLGALAAAITARPEPLRHAAALAATGCALFAASATSEVAAIGPPASMLHGGYALGSMLVILGLTSLERTGRRIAAGRGWQLLGAASYSLYLIHFPLISAGLKVARSLGWLAGGVNTLATCLILLAGTIALAVLLHIVVEKPLTAWLNQHLGLTRGAD